MTDNDLIPLLPLAELRLSRLVCVRKSRKLKGFAAVEILFVENKTRYCKEHLATIIFQDRRIEVQPADRFSLDCKWGDCKYVQY